MPLVFAGVCSHAPGIVGRADQADPSAKNRLYEAFEGMRHRLEASNPDALIVMGGPGASPIPEQCLRQFPQVDAIVRGEGEWIMKDLVQHFEQERKLIDADARKFKGGSPSN